MTIRHLTVFKAVCEEESITRAAKRLFMTQPAVSHVIADLEDRAGAPLFDRASRRLRLNQMGRQLYEKSCRVLEAYEELEKSMENLEQRTALRVGSSITIANSWLPGIISRFSKHAPDVPVEVTVDSAWRTSQRLEANEIDIAFIEGASYQEKFDSISFSSYQVIPLCAPDYFKERLFHRGERGESGWTLPPRALSEERLLLREKGSAIRDVFDGAMIQQDLKLSASWVSVNSQTLLHAAEAGLGITFLPDRLAEEWLEKGRLITFSLKGISLKNENHLALLKGKYISESMKLFIRLAQDPELL